MRKILLFSIMLLANLVFISAENRRTVTVRNKEPDSLTRVPVDYYDIVDGSLIVFFESSYNGICEISVFDRYNNLVLTDETSIQSCRNHKAPLETLQCGDYLVKIQTPTSTMTVGVEII